MDRVRVPDLIRARGSGLYSSQAESGDGTRLVIGSAKAAAEFESQVRINFVMEAKGKISVKRNRMAVNLNPDFTNYYIWFIERHFKIRVSGPKHGGHISLALPKFDKKVNWEAAKKYNKKNIVFSYSPYIRVGGQSKNFRNFMIDAYSDELKNICRECNINRKHFHITVANTKNMGRQDFWPKMINVAFV